MTSVLLISTYELGHQPFGLASPAAWLAEAGADVVALDLDIQPLDEAAVRKAHLIALYLPMHTATRLAIDLIPRLKALNPGAYLACYGLYAPFNAPYLRALGVGAIFGGEFEAGLTALFERLDTKIAMPSSSDDQTSMISLARQQFSVPARGGLPDLDHYARLINADGKALAAAYTEASRGCKHLCRHCPIVPVYNGRFRIVQPEIVLADIRQQVEAGARHITFGDPDFFNGPGHAIPIVQALHTAHPHITYDVTIKIEHLLKHDQLLPILRDTGCLFITSAVESVDDQILHKTDKGHSRADFYQAAARLREIGLTLNPTFIPFTPWTSVTGYLDLLSAVQELELVNHVSPIQYAIRLLIPQGSRLLELPDIHSVIGNYDEAALAFPWQHPDPQMDQLYERIFRIVQASTSRCESRGQLFERVWQAALDVAPARAELREQKEGWELAASPVPHLSEPWYC